MRITNGAEGLVIEVTVKEDDVAVDVSSATVKQIKAKGPTGTVKSWTADFKTTGTDGIIQYTTANGDIDETGIWSVQAYLEFSGGYKGYTFMDNFEVLEVLA